MISLSAVNRLFFVLLITWTSWASGYSKEELITQYKIRVNDSTRTVELPSESTITNSDNPVVKIVIQGNNIYLPVKKSEGKFIINVDDQEYAILNPTLINTISVPIFYPPSAPAVSEEQFKQLQQENKKLLEQMAQLQQQVEQITADRDRLRSDQNTLTREHKQNRKQAEQQQNLHKDELEQLRKESERAKKTLTRQLEQEREQHQKNLRRLESQQQDQKTQSEKKLSQFLSQSEKELKSRDSQHKHEVLTLTHSNQQLKEELKRAKHPDLSKKSVQTQFPDPEQKPDSSNSLSRSLPHTDSAFLQPEQPVDTTQTTESSVAKSSTGKSDTKKKQKKRRKKNDRKTNTSPPKDSGVKPSCDIEKYLAITHAVNRSFEKLEERKDQKHRKSPQLQLHNEGQLNQLTTTLLNAPTEDQSCAEDVVSDVVELLLDQTHRLKTRGNYQRMHKTLVQLIKLFTHFKTLHQTYSPLDILDMAFVQTDQPLSIEQDQQAMTLMSALQEQWDSFSITQRSILPSTLESDEALHSALETLVYGLMAEDYELVNQVIILLQASPLSELFSYCVFTTQEEDGDIPGLSGIEGESARKIFSLVVYIRRLTDYQLKHIQTGQLWAGLDRNDINQLLEVLKTLIEAAGVHQQAFEQGDILYVKTFNQPDQPMVIYSGELTMVPDWSQLLDSSPVVVTGAVVAPAAQYNPPTIGALALTGFIRQLNYWLVLQADFPPISSATIERLAELRITPLRRSRVKPCILDIARSQWGRGNIQQFLKQLLLHITQEPCVALYFHSMQRASCYQGKCPKSQAFLKLLIANSAGFETGAVPDWGGYQMFELIAGFLQRPVLMILGSGYVDTTEQIIAILFQPGQQGVNFSAFGEIQSLSQQHVNLLIIGFTPIANQAGAIPAETPGYWFQAIPSETEPVIPSTEGNNQTISESRSDDNGTAFINSFSLLPPTLPDLVLPMPLQPGPEAGYEY